MIPILNPAGVQEFLDYGLHGWAMSRFTGGWIAFKCDGRDGRDRPPRSMSTLDRAEIIIPDDFEMPAGGLNVRPALPCSARKRGCTASSSTPRSRLRGPTAQPHGLLGRPAARSSASSPPARPISTFARRSTISASTRPMPHDSACGSTRCVTYPIGRADLSRVRRGPRGDPRGRGEAGADRGAAARAALRDRGPAGLIGKYDERAMAVPGQGRARSQRRRDLPSVARLLKYRPQRRHPPRGSRASRRQTGTRRYRRISRCASRISARAARTTPRPWCPRAPRPAGIGCHYMAQWMDRNTAASPRWAARARTGSARRRSSPRNHVFQNLGDGTYYHSGSLAIRAAMPPAQHHLQIAVQRRGRHDRRPAGRRSLTVPQIAREMAAEGVKRVAWSPTSRRNIRPAPIWPRGRRRIHHRDDSMRCSGAARRPASPC